MKIYLWSLLLSLYLGAWEIPLHGSVYASSDDYFYIDITSLKYGETIKLEITFSHFFDTSNYCVLEYRSSDYYDDDEFLKEFDTIKDDNYDKGFFDYDFNFNLSKDNYYKYILLKPKLDYREKVTIYYNKSNSWVIWLVMILFTIFGIIILAACWKSKKTAKALAYSSHQPAVNYNQQPVNAYQPPVYGTQPPQYVQPS